MREMQNLPHVIRMKLASNIILGTLILTLGALCLAPIDEEVSAETNEVKIYRQAGENAKGVSLMFNVYWGTEEVYRILDILQAYEATATFFIGGCWADDNVDCLRDIYAAGHEIGNHGYFHKDHNKLDLLNNQKEIAECNRFIEMAIGCAPTLFAPPSGAYNDYTLQAVNALGMTTILWSKDTVDWRDKNAAVIYTRATKNVQIGDFILMHPMKETADALEDILKFYQSNGLETVTVSQNIQKDG
ncbi:MAG: polysaccharide deacetylase [Clostridiales bacterium]|nr:polysaccharide deacetylase [Clostridiales bacterium]